MSEFNYEIKHDAPHRVFTSESSRQHSSAKSYPEAVRNTLQISLFSQSDDELTFDLSGIDVSIANALRRIMLSEVPTMAVENVYIEMNTSIIFDEVLAHRLGLIPINADPRKFKMVEKEVSDEKGGKTREVFNEDNTIIFTLNKVCKRPVHIPSVVDGRPYTENIYSSDFKWQPQGNQSQTFPDGISPLYPDILIAMLRPGQEISLEMHCRKGNGMDHAKFSPVATSSYRLHPKITITKDLDEDSAEKLVQICPMNVFDIEDVGSVKTAKVARPRNCTMCRECIRGPGWSDRIKLERISNHFIFKVESCSALKSAEILLESVQILRQKCAAFINMVDGSQTFPQNSA
mmetsp:Transcript_5942/g.8944  ORF Transcript_5942/g.8944 Transcript_5942/m.8944 type:complete len:347 (+) Transcript_5942:94-1134(+)